MELTPNYAQDAKELAQTAKDARLLITKAAWARILQTMITGLSLE